MSTKYVSDTAAGKSISAWIIMKRRRHIATVRAHFSNGGTCTVNVFNHGDKNKSAAENGFQHGSASGYGYDKLIAALSGLKIDGHRLTNHCEGSKQSPDGRLWPRDAVAPKGWHFANWTSFNFVKKGEDSERVELPKSQQGYSSCYRESGLKYLEAIGYQVIQAI